MKLRTFLLCFATAIALTLCASAADVVDSGTCGDNLTWTLDGDGVLTISGKGAMDDWSDFWQAPNHAPWYEKGSSIVTVIIRSGVTYIGSYAFEHCRTVRNVTIPDSVTNIGKRAFWGCYMTSVTIPDSVTNIGEWAFANCYNLTSVTIPDSVTNIGEYAFAYCSGLKTIQLSDGIVSIGDCAFYECKQLTDVTIPASVTSIGASAFRECTGLTSVTFSDGMPSIGDSAFWVCTSLTKVTIPASVTYVSSYAFSECASLTDIFVDVDNQNYASVSGVLFDKNQTTLICYPAGKTGEYEIPDGVTSINAGAFEGCRNLTSIIIPDSVTTIGEDAFLGCIGLTNVKMSEHLTNINVGTFASCSNLENITIPDSVTDIDGYAFSHCKSLISVAISDGVSNIYQYAFQGCSKLESVAIGNGISYISGNAFKACDNLTDIYYAGSAAQWSEIRLYDDALKSATVHYNAKDVGVGITLTDKSGEIVDGNGQAGEKEDEKKDVFQDGAEFTASFAAVDPDAVTSGGLVTANVFLIFYDRDGLMVSLEAREIDLSDPFNLMFVLELRIPEGAKTLKFLMLGDNFEPLRAARMIEKSGATA